MAKDHPVGNTDDSKRGRGTDPESYKAIGQKIPKNVMRELERNADKSK
jgi:hypothetical protein